MHSPPQSIAIYAARQIRTVFTITTSRPSRSRAFHITTPISLPRKRNFFTSNPFLSQSGEESLRGAGNKDDRANSSTQHLQQQQEQHEQQRGKRKQTRAAATKNSLRRVAIIAQQPQRVDAVTRQPSPQDVGGSDSRNVVSATCIAEGFNMSLVVDTLLAHGFAIDPDGTGFESSEVVHARGVSGGDIFVFPSGTIVTWSLPPDVITRQIMRAAEDAHLVGSREVEDLEYTTDGGRDTSTLKGDLIVLGTRKEVEDGDRLDTTLAKVAFSSGLARSTKLAVLETSLTTYFESTRHVPALLTSGAGISLSRRFILRKTGELLSLRARLNHYSELTDSLPDIFWDSRSELGLEGYYELVGRALDVNVRIRALNQKMDYAQEIATVLREMASEQHGTRLEWIIIVLIAVEVVFELRRIFLESVPETEAEDEAVIHAKM